MNAEQIEIVETKWIPALRSGKYVQGQFALNSEYKGVCHYCCLGVLCSELDFVQLLKPSEVTGVREALDTRTGQKDSGLLPESVAEFMGMPYSYLPVPESIVERHDAWGYLKVGNNRIMLDEVGANTARRGGSKYVVPLSTLNDSGNWSFSGIADILQIVVDAWKEVNYYKVFPWNDDLISVQKYYVNNESNTVWAIDLAALNDEGWSFDKIADIIKAVAKEWERVEAE